jgi:hypothetical protein
LCEVNVAGAKTQHIAEETPATTPSLDQQVAAGREASLQRTARAAPLTSSARPPTGGAAPRARQMRYAQQTMGNNRIARVAAGDAEATGAAGGAVAPAQSQPSGGSGIGAPSATGPGSQTQTGGNPELSFYHGTTWTIAKAIPGNVKPLGGGDFAAGFYTHHDKDNEKALRRAKTWGLRLARQKRERSAGVVIFSIARKVYERFLRASRSKIFNLTRRDQADYEARQREWLKFVTSHGREEEPEFQRRGRGGVWGHPRREPQPHLPYDIISGPFYGPIRGREDRQPEPEEFQPYAEGEELPQQVAWANKGIDLLNSTETKTELRKYDTRTAMREEASDTAGSITPASGVSDRIPEVENQFYAHGGFMGAAPELLADRKWNRILEVLMPDVHADATRALRGGKGSDEIIPMFENNPVMAAYGLYQTRAMDIRREGGRSDRVARMRAIEWDVFLPTAIVEAYKKARDEAERTQLAGQMVNEMIIAHGTTWQTIKENAMGRRQYENVKGTRKSGQGGVRPGAWMDLFGRALQLAVDPGWEERATEYQDPARHPRYNTPDDQARHLTFLERNQLEFREVIDLYKDTFHQATFSVLLDIKSRDATPPVLRAVVRELNRRGVHVYGVGTFQHHEVSGLGSMTQEVEGRRYRGPREVRFFHLAGDLQQACLDGKIAEGDTVMFNAGSLINYQRYARGPEKKASYHINAVVINQLRQYKRYYGFHLGVYVQEYDIDDRAATMITELTNANRDVFDLGFAWGGLSGRTAGDIEPSLTNATVGMGAQNLDPRTKHWDVSKPVPSSGFRSTISIRHRYLKSRHFTALRGSITVTCNAGWNRPDCGPDAYYITLVRSIDWWPDSEKGSVKFPAGRLQQATWLSVESGEYYLQIWFPVDTNPSCVLTGDIVVAT